MWLSHCMKSDCIISSLTAGNYASLRGNCTPILISYPLLEFSFHFPDFQLATFLISYFLIGPKVRNFNPVTWLATNDLTLPAVSWPVWIPTSALDGGGWSSRPGRLYSRERPTVQEAGVRPRAGLDRCGKCRPPPGFDPRTFQAEASRCTDWATPAPLSGGNTPRNTFCFH